MTSLFNWAGQQLGVVPATIAASITGENVGNAAVNSLVNTGTSAISGGNIFSAIGTAASAIGAIAQGNAQAAAGRNQATAAAYQADLANRQAANLETQAGQERAASQRGAEEQRRQGRLVSSRANALAAASGGGALDPTINDIQAGINTEADYRALTALYQGNTRAQGLEYNASLARAGGAGDLYAGQVAQNAGNAAQTRSYFSAAGNLAAGAGNIYDRINLRTPNNTILSQGTGTGLSRYGYG